MLASRQSEESEARRLHREVPRSIGLLGVSALLVLGCSGSGNASDAPSSVGTTAVSAALKEFSITLDSGTAPAGTVDIALANDGTTEHEFVIFQTDLAADQLPLTDDGVEVDEEGEGLTAVDEVEDIAPGGTPHLTVDLQPGKYVFICNLPAHYVSGMRVAFEVTGS